MLVPAVPAVPAGETRFFADLARDASVASASGDPRSGTDARAEIRAVLSQWSDPEMEQFLALAVGLESEHLRQIRDLRGYAVRLAELALRDVWFPGDSALVEVAPLRLTRTFDASGRADRPQPFVSQSTVGFYAVLPEDVGERDEVLVRWVRADDPELLRFRTHPIGRTDAGETHLWIEPPVRLTPGEYRLEVYSLDEVPELLATHAYPVVPDEAVTRGGHSKMWKTP